MQITHITLITGSGCDVLIMTTDLPNGCWPFNDKASVKMDVAANEGLDYCNKFFPLVPLKIVDTR